MPITVVGLDRALAKLTAAEAAAPAALRLGMEVTAARVATVIVPAIRQATPVRSGMLANSTRAETTPTSDGFDVTVSQPALSAKNADGSGGGYPYVAFVIKGRGPIVAPSSGPFSTGKKALAGPGFGPVKRVKAAPGHDYVSPAVRDADSALEEALRAGSVAVKGGIGRVLRGGTV